MYVDLLQYFIDLYWCQRECLLYRHIEIVSDGCRVIALEYWCLKSQFIDPIKLFPVQPVGIICYYLRNWQQ